MGKGKGGFRYVVVRGGPWAAAHSALPKSNKGRSTLHQFYCHALMSCGLNTNNYRYLFEI